MALTRNTNYTSVTGTRYGLARGIQQVGLTHKTRYQQVNVYPYEIKLLSQLSLTQMSVEIIKIYYFLRQLIMYFSESKYTE